MRHRFEHNDDLDARGYPQGTCRYCGMKSRIVEDGRTTRFGHPRTFKEYRVPGTYEKYVWTRELPPCSGQKR